MKTLPALAATAVTLLALTGCATTVTAAPTPTVTVTADSADSARVIDATNIYRHVHSAWKGDNPPSKPWIDDAAMLVCKQLIGGIEPRVVGNSEIPSRVDDGNNRVIIMAAQKFVCEADR